MKNITNEHDVQVKLELPYFYGKEMDNLLFFKLPKILFTDERFQKLSTDCKVLYSFMLDRVKLSIQSNWRDEEGRVYIIYTNEEACKWLNKTKKTISNFMSELDSEKGMGLIERKKQGLGKPDLIYVKNLISLILEEDTDQNKICKSEVVISKPDVNHVNSIEKLSTFEENMTVDKLECGKNLPLLNSNSCPSRGVNITPLEEEKMPPID